MIDHQLSSFLVGIRFVRKFSILDKWGEILDMVLSNNEFFASDYFNQIQNANGPELVLSDPYGGYLRLNSTDLIFSKSFVQPSNNTAIPDINIDQEILFCKERICKFLAPCILEHFDAITQRVGVVFSYLVDEKSSIAVAKKYFNGPIEKQFEYRFSVRDIAPITQARKDKCDYINKIYSSTRASDTTYMVSYDYQYFFEPAQAIISDKIAKVIESGEAALKKESFFRERD